MKIWNNYLNLSKLNVLCKYFYPDGTVINAFSDTVKFAEEIESNSRDKKETVFNYLSYCKKIFDLTADLFLFKSFSEPGTFLNRKALKTLVNVKKIDPFRTMHEANSAYFADPKIIQLFDRYATYNGSDPFKSPATLNIIPHVENNIGGYIAEKGMYSIPSALKILAEKKGVSIQINSNVQKIHIQNSKVKGISVDGEFLPFDFVISNSDISYTYKNLLGDSESKLAKRYSKLEKSSSAIVFYWGMDILSDLEIHNILFSENYKKEFDELFNQKSVPVDPTVYIYISSKFNSTDAPQGMENWFVMINVPYNTNQDWEAEVVITKKRIIEKIKRILGINIENKIICESSINSGKNRNADRQYRGKHLRNIFQHTNGGIP